MAGITLAQAETNLSLYLDAAAAVATGQSYSIGRRSLTRANLKEINESINYWQGWVNRLSNGSGGIRISGATPC